MQEAAPLIVERSFPDVFDASVEHGLPYIRKDNNLPVSKKLPDRAKIHL